MAKNKLEVHSHTSNLIQQLGDTISGPVSDLGSYTKGNQRRCGS